jgi:hypothetical protein
MAVAARLGADYLAGAHLQDPAEPDLHRADRAARPFPGALGRAETRRRADVHGVNEAAAHSFLCCRSVIHVTAQFLRRLYATICCNSVVADRADYRGKRKSAFNPGIRDVNTLYSRSYLLDRALTLGLSGENRG